MIQKDICRIKRALPLSSKHSSKGAERRSSRGEAGDEKAGAVQKSEVARPALNRSFHSAARHFAAKFCMKRYLFFQLLHKAVIF